MLTNIFCTPIDEISIKNKKFIELINAEYLYCEKNNLFKNNWQPDNDTTPTTFKETNNILKQSLFLQSFIENKCISYLDSVNENFDEVKVVDTWFNKQCKNQIVGTHNHRNPGLKNQVSGVFYVKTINDSKQGKITFISPNAFNYEFPSETPNVKYTREVSFNPIQNNMILFPSTLSHKVTMNNTDEDRVVLSFNLEYKNG